MQIRSGEQPHEIRKFFRKKRSGDDWAPGVCAVDGCTGTRMRAHSWCKRHNYYWVEFKLNPDDYERILRAQHGACAVCKRACKSGRALSVDHCHVTGAIRGLLCGPCNRGIGLLGDNARLVERAVGYLRAAEKQ